VDVPIIIIVNNGSASASEIVTAALKKNRRAVVMGIQTFGKGSVQQVIPFKEGSALRLTTSKYLTPGDISIQSVGVTPHIAVTPYYISTDFLHVTSPKLDQAEKSLEQDFEEWGDKAEPPLQTVFYLFEDKDNENEDETDEIDLSIARQKNLEKDFLVQSAISILRENGKREFDQLLDRAMSHMKTEQEGQQAKLISRFAAFEIPIDWREYHYREQGRINSTVWLESKSTKTENGWVHHEGPISADSEIRLHLKAENVGKTPIARLLAITNSNNQIFDDRQFAFGRLKPNESKEWYIPIKIAESSVSRDNLISFVFYDEQKRALHKDSISLIIKEKQRPRFNFTIVPFENGNSQPSDNSNGILETGETVDLKIEVTNKGLGNSGPLTVLLRNGEGKAIFLKKGRANLSPLTPNSASTAVLSFDLKEIPTDNNLDFSLDILDGTYPLASVNQKIKMALSTQSALIANTPPAIQLQVDELLSRKPVCELSGIIDDPEGVKDMFVFQNNKKIFYRNFMNEQNRRLVEFNLKLELKDEANEIVLVSRDDSNVTARKIHYLRYEASK